MAAHRVGKDLMITTDALTADRRGAVGALLEAATTHDGVAPLDEAARLALAGPGAHHLLIEQDSEQDVSLVGYAGVLADGTTQGMVHPDHRRRGQGTALLRAALAHRPDAGVWAHGALPASLAFLEAQGLTEVRRLLVLHRQLGAEHPLPPVPAPRLADLRISTFEVERDAEDWLALNASAFADHPEQGALTRADLDRRLAEPWFDPEDLLLARHEGELLGAVWTKRTAESAAAEIYVVATAPAAQGKGVAGHLLGTALQRLADRGVPGVELYVEGDNAPALGLYERWGFTTAEQHVQLRAEEG